MKNTKNFIPKTYSAAWLKELKLALKNPNFKVTKSNIPLGIKSDHPHTTEYFDRENYKRKVILKQLTDKEWENLQIARTLIDAHSN